MRVRINGTTWLTYSGTGDELAVTRAADVVLNRVPIIDAAGLIRAGWLQFFNRSQALNELAFSVARQFATKADAEDFALSYQLTALPHPNVCPAAFYIDHPGGTAIFTISPAAIDPPERDLTTAATVLLRYTIRGGPLIES